MTDTPAAPHRTQDHPIVRHGTSIQMRLLLLVMAAALPPLLFSFFQARAASRAERSGAEQRAEQLARRVAARVDDHVNTIDAVLVALSRTLQPVPAATVRNDSVLAWVSRDLGPRFLLLSVATPDGRVVGLSTPRQLTGTPTIADRRYFREAMRTGALGIGDPMIGRVSGESALAFGRAILDSSGRAIGVVSASTLIDRLREIVITDDLPEAAVVTLLDRNGRVLARTASAPPLSPRAIAALTTGARRVGHKSGVIVLSAPNSDDDLVGYSSSQRVPWTAYVDMSSSVALQRTRAQEHRAMLLFGGSLALSLLLASLLARGISDPVRALTADAEAFASGALSRRATVTANGELGTLATTFNRMAEALQRRGAELRASEQRYRSLFDTLPLPMWVYDVKTLRFLAANEAAVAHYGYTREEFLERTVADIRPLDDAARFHDTVALARVRRLYNQQWHHRTKSGAIIDVEISSDELLYGTARARLVVVNDVTLRRRTEDALRASQEQLRQSQKLEAIGSLAGGIAHDFNNLLTAMLGYCDLALDGMEADSPASADVVEIRRAALRAAELTRQLLAFSRRQVLKPVVFALAPAVQQTEKILRRLISENIALELIVAADTPLVCADPAQLEQVILNLALNARDAMPRGGRLRVRTSACVFDAPLATEGSVLPSGEYALLEVADTGTGIDAEARERLFEPFFTTKARGQGTGLGLATVYGIMQQSGGGIGVASAAGEGATFTLYFPVATPPAPNYGPATPARPMAAAERRREGTILLAEDDDAVRAIARETLERAGYHVLAAADGRSALALADSYGRPIDLLLTDVIMPGMNGRELADALVARQPGLKVLFASGYTNNVLHDQGALAQGVTLLDKPFTPAALAAKVAEVLAAPPAAEQG